MKLEVRIIDGELKLFTETGEAIKGVRELKLETIDDQTTRFGYEITARILVKSDPVCK